MSTVIPGFVPILSSWDTPEQRRFALPPQYWYPRPNVMSQMITRNINIPYFNHSNVSLHKNVVLASYASGRCVEEGWDETSYSRLIAAAEIVEPYLHAACFAEAKTSRKLFVRGCLKSLGGNYTNSLIQASGIVDFAHYSHESQEIQTIVRRFPTENLFNDNVDATIQALVASSSPVVDATYTHILAEAVAQIMDSFCRYVSNEGRAASTAIYTIMYIGLAKRWELTQNTLKNVNSQIKLETNLDVQIKMSEVEKCMEHKVLVDQTRVKEIIEHLAQNIGRFSVGLEIIMHQATISILTHYWIIRVAFAQCSDFPWDEALSTFIGEDFEQFIAAYKIIQDNKYYHLKTNLSAVRHLKYATLGWLAAQLLIKNNPEQFNALQNIRSPRPNNSIRRAGLQQLLDKHEPAVNRDNVVNPNSKIEAYKISGN